jgi:hypothetical protein
LTVEPEWNDVPANLNDSAADGVDDWHGRWRELCRNGPSLASRPRQAHALGKGTVERPLAIHSNGHSRAPVERRFGLAQLMNCPMPLERVLSLDFEHPKCGGESKIIVAILQQPVTRKILTHLGLRWIAVQTTLRHGPF